MSYLKRKAVNSLYWLTNIVADYGDSKGCLLGYHYLEVPFSPYSISKDFFEKQLDFLSEHCTVVKVSEFIDAVEDKQSEENIVCLTFDDGTLDQYTKIYPMLEERDMLGTFYITTNYLGDQHPSTAGPLDMMDESHVKELHNNGHEIGSHSLSHPDLTSITYKSATQEIFKSKSILESIIEDEVSTFAYPHNETNEKIINTVKEAGYACAVNGNHGNETLAENFYKLPRLPVTNKLTYSKFKVKTAMNVF